MFGKKERDITANGLLKARKKEDTPCPPIDSTLAGALIEYFTVSKKK